MYLMCKIICLVYFVRESLTAGIYNLKENDPRCLIPKDDYCEPGYAYIHSANICQEVSDGECTTNILPFKNKKECEMQCIVDIAAQNTMPAVGTFSTAKEMQKEYRNNETQSHSDLLDKQEKKHFKNDKILKDSGISVMMGQDSNETTSPAYVDINDENSNIQENDYDWYNYKDYMVNNVPRCEQPREVSMCRGFWPRWWFNKSAGECQQFTYGGCGRDDQTTNNFLTHHHCLTVCFEIIPCPDDKSKACNVSTTECAAPSCQVNQDVICQVEPCSCKATYIDDFGDEVICTTETHQQNGDNDYAKDTLPIWVLWLCGILTMIVLVLCIFCCYRCLRPQASYRTIIQDTSISLDSSEGNFTPRKVFEKPVKS